MVLRVVSSWHQSPVSPLDVRVFAMFQHVQSVASEQAKGGGGERTHTHTHARTHARTHTHTHLFFPLPHLSLSVCLCLSVSLSHTHTHTHSTAGYLHEVSQFITACPREQRATWEESFFVCLFCFYFAGGLSLKKKKKIIRWCRWCLQ